MGMVKFVKAIFILIFLSMVLVGCDKETIELNKEFILELCETKTIKDGTKSLTLRYSQLIEDSLCP